MRRPSSGERSLQTNNSNEPTVSRGREGVSTIDEDRAVFTLFLLSELQANIDLLGLYAQQGHEKPPPEFSMPRPDDSGLITSWQYHQGF